MVRSTTNGVLKSYRYNLQRSTYNLNNARNTVLTGRTFNTFADDPATAARCFQLRRSFERVNSQYSVGQSVVRKYEVAWSTIESVVSDVNNVSENSALAAIVRGSTDSTGAGRSALGQELEQLAQGIIQTMNAKYGDNFVFAGADGQNVPFELDTETGTLTYRGIDVSSKDTNDIAALEYMANDEKKFADIGLGLQEDESGSLIQTSAFDVALQGITFLGYGTDADGDPKNIVCIIARMGQILKNCDEGGTFAEGEKEEFDRLFEKFGTAADALSNQHTALDTRTAFLKSNQEQLENNAYTLQEQFLGMEDVDEAEAITAYSWAQYCYNAALKVGNSILSQSLMDYLNT